MLNQDYITAEIDSSFWTFEAYDTTESTNILVKNRIKSGEKGGSAICALQQKGGYGRQGRQWISPYGGFYISFSVCPDLPLIQLSTFALVVSLAAKSALYKVAGIETVSIKWPNDILCNEAKMAGISLEVVEGTSLCAGIGFNVFKPYQDVIKATKYEVAYVSNQPETKAKFLNLPFEVGESGLNDIQVQFLESLAIVFLNEMEAYYKKWEAQGFVSLREEYSDSLSFKGYSISMQTLDESVIEEGLMLDVDEEGRLLIQKLDGSIQAVNSGEVHITHLGKR